jgi:hypothetical protein
MHALSGVFTATEKDGLPFQSRLSAAKRSWVICMYQTITQLQSLAVLNKQVVRNFLAALQEPADEKKLN